MVIKAIRYFARPITALSLMGLCSLGVAESEFNTDVSELEVIDAYAEIHSGPGRGYPVFYTVEQGEKINILSRRPGWYEIKTESGKLGWATASQISRTIQNTGEPADLPTVSYGDFIKNSWFVGMNTGQFSAGELEGFEVFGLSGGYRFLEWLGADVEFGRLFGSDASGEYYAGNLYFEPFNQWKLSPYGSIGMGALDVDSLPKQIDFSQESSDFYSYGIGASYYLGRNFIVKGEYRWYSVSVEDDSENLATWKIGFNTYF